MRILALLLLLLLRQAPTHAVEPFTVVSPEPLLEEGRWQALHTAKSVIQDIWVDSLGVLLSTGTGLETYDGYRWQVIDGPDSLLVASRKALLRDGTGDIWVATTSGLIGRYDGTGWHVYSQADG